MKTITSQMEAHLAQGRTTLARAYRVTRTDGQVFGFTSHVRDIHIDGVLYRSTGALSASALQQASTLAADNMEVLGAFGAGIVTEQDIYAGIWSHARVKVFDFNYRDLTMGTIPQPGFILGEVRSGRGTFMAEAWGLSKLLQKPLGRMYLPLCPHDLGDGRCKVNLGSITHGIVSGTVTAVTDRRIFTASALPAAAPWHTGGKVTWTGASLNAGRVMEVREHASGGVITLHLPMFYAIQVGDTFQITAGCLKRIVEDCHTKFDNRKNHGGYALMPGVDRVISGK